MHLRRLHVGAGTLEPQRANALNAIATAGMQLLEQIVLKEVDDTRASLEQVAKS